MEQGRSECVLQASDQINQECTCVRFYSKDTTRFATGHNGAIKLWQLNTKTSKFSRYDVQLGQIKRKVTCLAIDSQDNSMFCGTRQGDVIEVLLKTGRYKRFGAIRKVASSVTAVNCFFGSLILGYANGHIAKVEKTNLTFEQDYGFDMGSIQVITNSSEKIWALTQGGSLHSVDGNKASLQSQTCFMSSIT